MLKDQRNSDTFPLKPFTVLILKDGFRCLLDAGVNIMLWKEVAGLQDRAAVKSLKTTARFIQLAKLLAYLNNCLLLLFVLEVVLSLSLLESNQIYFEFMSKALSSLFYLSNFWFNGLYSAYYHQSYRRKLFRQLIIGLLFITKCLLLLFRQTGAYIELRLLSCCCAGSLGSLLILVSDLLDVALIISIYKTE